MLEKDASDEDVDTTSSVKHSKLRKANVTLLAEEDRRYAGKRVTRKSLEIPMAGPSRGFEQSKFYVHFLNRFYGFCYKFFKLSKSRKVWKLMKDFEKLREFAFEYLSLLIDRLEHVTQHFKPHLVRRSSKEMCDF